ncbi:MAG: MarR family winged helix-turn-helix transcriptional regulator [Acidimicrobiia bacterium]
MTSGAERPLTDDEYHSLAEFRHALRRFLAFSEDAARAQGITPAQHQLLLTVRGAEAVGTAPSLSDVAEHLHVRLHSAGELVARAVEAGLVERHDDPHDGRRTLVATTAAGRAHLEQLSMLHRRELRRFRSEMNDLLEQIDE